MLFKVFWILVVLVGFLLIRNALYAVQQFLVNKNRAWFASFTFLLCFLGYLLFHLSFRALEFIQTATEAVAAKDV